MSRLDNDGFASLQIEPVLKDLVDIRTGMEDILTEVQNMLDDWYAIYTNAPNKRDPRDQVESQNAMALRIQPLAKKMDQVLRYLDFSTSHRMSYSDFKELQLVGSYRIDARKPKDLV
ncbi:MAG: hypothetical protein ACRD5H_18075 [Nitrososphaerales archaeon]